MMHPAVNLAGTALGAVGAVAAFGSPNSENRGQRAVWATVARKNPTSFIASNLVDRPGRVDRYALAPLLSELDRFKKLEDGWDGPGSLAPSKDAVTAAQQFVSSLNASVKAPEIAAGNDGEVNISWRDNRSFIDLSFYTSSGGILYARQGDRKIKERGVNVVGDMPSDVVSWLIGR